MYFVGGYVPRENTQPYTNNSFVEPFADIEKEILQNQVYLKRAFREFAQVQLEMQKDIRALREEIRGSGTIARGNDEVDMASHNMPSFPLQTEEEFAEIESILDQNNDARKYLVSLSISPS